MRYFGAIAAMILACAPLRAAGPGFSVDGRVLLSSAYLWRGDRVCGTHFNPDVCLNFGNFTIENYDYLSFDGQYKEIDWDLSWKAGDFTFHLADYYARYASDPGKENFFNWKKGQTNHVDEIALVYDSSLFPLTAKWFTFFWGDWIPDSTGAPDRLSLSSYLELGTYYKSEKWGICSLALGASVLKGSYTNYSRDFAPIHLELKYEKILDAGSIRIPVGASFVVNPYNHSCYGAAWAGFEF
ncbi:MAG: hypothetical protein IJU68_02150 [Bacteroidales bacterium]|nr:hypothetical protein [Bacteroidales bacterium]